MDIVWLDLAHQTYWFYDVESLLNPLFISLKVTNDFFFLQADLKALEEREADLKREMTLLKERNHSLEQMVNELLSKGDKDLALSICSSYLNEIVGVIKTRSFHSKRKQ